MDRFEPGDIIGGYRVEEEVARGGMGTIYRASHVELGSCVAIKVLKRDFASRPDVIKRFLREGKLIAHLDHPGIIKLFDVGRERDCYYLVMEFVDGENLQRIVDQDGPLSARQALAVGREVADALAHAHDNGIVHRDVKPSNILLSRTGKAFITDFGIARVLEHETNLTQAGVLLGTPSHMSPEQCRASVVDARSDIYSLGATLYTILGGRPPFTSTTPARLIHQLIHDNPPPLDSVARDVPPEVALLVKRMMAKHPAARIQTAREVRDAIDEIRKGGGRRSEAPPVEIEAEESSSTSPVGAAVVVILCAIGLAFAGLALWTDPETPAAADAAAGTPDANAGGGGNAGGDHRRERPGATAPRAGSRKGEGKDADKDEETARPTRRELRAKLKRRLVSFQRALVAGRPEEVYRHIDPRVRNHPALLISLGKLMKALDGVGENPALDYRLVIRGERAEVLFTFENRSTSQIARFPTVWRYSGGAWFLRPTRPGPAPPR